MRELVWYNPANDEIFETCQAWDNYTHCIGVEMGMEMFYGVKPELLGEL